MLTPELVHQIRTGGLADTWWADKLRMRPHSIRHARIGRTYPDHPTRPDTAPRDGTGRRTNSDPVRAKPRRQRRQWTWE